MSDFTKLLVWRKAHALTLNVLRVATGIRRSELVSLRNQMIRAAMSVPTNIVEERGQFSEREFCRFLRYALNSCSELEYHVILARDIGVITHSNASSVRDQAIEVRRMLYGLVKTVSNRDSSPQPTANAPTQ